MALGDIGQHFPDTDPAYKGADSIALLNNVAALIEEEGYKLGNLDSQIIAQKPKLAPHIQEMRSQLARALNCDIKQVSVKATTTEKLGYIGKEEGIAAQAIVLLEKNDTP